MTQIQKHAKARRNWKYPVVFVGVLFAVASSFYLLTRDTQTTTPTSPNSPPKVTGTKELEKSATDDKSEVPTTPAITTGTVAVEPIKEKDAHASTILKEKNYPQYRYEALATANDQFVSGSWYHSTIQSDRAWDLSTGSSSTVIAVVDSGFALAHEDLTGRWQTNSGEQGNTSVGGICWTGSAVSKTTNNCDDDQNGYVDDWRGWDFSTNDNDVQTGVVNPTGSGTQHGTLVSGIIAATANNSLGNAGIDWQAKIMPLQALSDNGVGYTYDIVSAVEYAVDNGADIINLSLGGNEVDEALLAAVTYAKSQGVLVVAASGNCAESSVDICAGLATPGRMTYPAKFEQVLSVGATTTSDVRSSFSSYGPELDIVAPGSSVGPLASWSNVYTTNGYVSSANGTSFSSPIVAGIAGVLRAQMGTPTVDQLTAVLTGSTDKVGNLISQNRSDEYGYGRVNAHKATLLARAIITPPGNTGTTAIGPHYPAQGGITRSRTGNIQTDEWVVVACRVDISDSCSSVVTNGGSVVRTRPADSTKAVSVYYMFVKGSSLSAGTSIVSVHSRDYATSVGSLVK